jgi:hypothetical protein
MEHMSESVQGQLLWVVDDETPSEGNSCGGCVLIAQSCHATHQQIGIGDLGCIYMCIAERKKGAMQSRKQDKKERMNDNSKTNNSLDSIEPSHGSVRPDALVMHLGAQLVQHLPREVRAYQKKT